MNTRETLDPKALAAGAAVEAAIDGRDFVVLGRGDKERYISRFADGVRAYLSSLSTPIAAGSGEAKDRSGNFVLGDHVETAKGAKFWGEIVAFDNDASLPGCTVLAIDPNFAGTKHVYPLKQLQLRALSPCRIGEETEEEKPIAIKPLEWGQDASGNWFAPTSFGQRYYIYQNSDGQFAVSFGGSVQMAGDVEGAKVVAQVDFESRLRASLSRKTAGEADGWQTMETAPKDGTKFLAYEKGRYFDCWWHENGHGEAYWMDEADSEPSPSDWMPLPAAPEVRP